MLPERRKIFYIAMMTATSVLFFVLIAVGVYTSNINTKQLLLVHVVSRHGARTPVDTYPNDPYINDTFHPIGWGQLTNEGKNDLFRLGKDIRTRYGRLLGDSYDSKIFYSQSTDVDRTIASVQIMNAGIWEPKGDQKWGPLNWQPVPVHYESLANDMLLLVRKPCAQYEMALQDLIASEPVQKKLEENEDLFGYLEHWSGRRIKDFDDVQDLYSTLNAEHFFNLTLPAWTHDVFPEKMRELTAFSYKLRAYNTFLVKFKGGVLLKKIVNDWTAKMDGEIPERKMFLYGGHDSTIANLLSALDVFTPHVPDYGSTVFLEFSRDRLSNKHGVEIYYRKSICEPTERLRMPGCDDWCPFDEFLQLVAGVIPKDWESECHSDDPNFTVPDAMGP